MKCAEWRELASARLDGALDSAELESLAAHLDGCEPCRAHAERLAGARDAVASLPSRVAVPSGLALRIEAEALRGLRPPRRRAWILAVVAAAAVVGVVARTMVGEPARRLPTLCTTLVEDHIRYLHVERAAETPSSEPVEIARWFDERLDFTFGVPRLIGAVLVGGRVCVVEGRSVALLFYEYRGRRLSLFVLSQAVLRGLAERPDGSWLGDMHGFRVRAVREGDLTYALVGDLDEPDLAALWKGIT